MMMDEKLVSFETLCRREYLLGLAYAGFRLICPRARA